MSASVIGRAALRRLRSGIVASSHLRSLSVGADSSIRAMRVLTHMLRAGTSKACFVHGEWGSGKTHLLALIRQVCLEEGYAVAYLNLNGNSAALNHPQRFYHLKIGRASCR